MSTPRVAHLRACTRSDSSAAASPLVVGVFPGGASDWHRLGRYRSGSSACSELCSDSSAGGPLDWGYASDSADGPVRRSCRSPPHTRRTGRAPQQLPSLGSELRLDHAGGLDPYGNHRADASRAGSGLILTFLDDHDAYDL